jgi:peptide chain release factor 1
MLERLMQIEKRYDEISLELTNIEVIKDIKKMTLLNKEQASLKDAYFAYKKYKELNGRKEDSKELINDPELGELASLELKEIEEELKELESEIEILLLPKDENDDKNVVVEIRGAAGGDEGNIFAADLYRMYTRYAEKEGFKIEELEAEEKDAGGYALVSFLIKGNGAYSRFKYESGAHRVQRVPVTETQGRVHTSTATVLVMPEADDFDYELDMSEVKIDVARSSGCGGQSVNTTDSAVRLTHIPTGIVVFSQTERSQIKNREKGIRLLQTRIHDYYETIEQEKLGVERKSKIGTGDRSEKIRTYNYPQNRVTDHRINLTIKQLDRIMDGDLGQIIDELIHEDNIRKMKGNE